jgi:dihydroflavonol-4-reductase
VKGVVLTSSVAATSPREESPNNSVSDETQWTDVADPKLGAYGKSKTLAERAAWDLIAEKGGTTSLATVNPALVIGPVLSKDFSGSIQLVERLVAGRLPGLPRLGFNVVDVRDVAELHIRAMTAPEAAGQRLIAAGAWVWMADAAAILKAKLGEGGRKVPTNKVPDFVVHLMGLFDKDIAGVASGLGRRHDFTSAKAERLLGWRSRPLEETLVDCANSLIAEGAV